MWMHFFFPEVTKRHCQSGGIRAHFLFVCEIGHFRNSRFLFHSSVYKYNGTFPRISFTIFCLWTFKNIPFYYLLCLVSISRFLNAPKNSKFEGRDNSNGNPLLHDGNIFFFHEIFSIYIQKHFLQFFLTIFVFSE